MEENGMKQVFVMLCACLFLLWGLGAASRAQSVSNKDEGSSPTYSGNERGIFRILFNGEQIGEEKFQIVADASNFRAFAEISLTVEREKDKATFTIKPLLQFKKTFEPISYEVLQESGPNKMKAHVNFKPGRSEALYETERQKDPREIELRPDVVVLDDNVFHHYILLARRYDFLKGGVQEFPAFIPQQFLAGTITVEDKGMEKVALGGSPVPLQHLFVDSGELQFSLWLNKRHELLKISVPKSNVDVERQ
jgi:hypothetical protein